MAMNTESPSLSAHGAEPSSAPGPTTEPGADASAIFNEMFGPGGEPRAGYAKLQAWLDETPDAQLEQRRREAETLFRRSGITFAVYGEEEADERIIPFDIVPRILTQGEWQHMSRGLEQRVGAINAFLGDVYGAQEILKAGIVPEDLIFQNEAFQAEMVGLEVPHGLYVHICGIDLVRVDADTFYVLEDNARVPSGVSYMLENREMTTRLMPELFARHRIHPVENYPDAMLSTLRSVAPRNAARAPNVVILTPGQYNSAYYEHSFLANRAGIELVEAPDLFVRGEKLYMRTTQGPQQVDVIYRRVDDEFLDPLTFRADSMLGVPGLMQVYRAGNVTLANAVGTGIADDKAIYSYMPEIIRFYTGEDPIIENVPTWRCREADACAYVLDNLKDLVVKEVHGSGGYGMLIGPHATKAEIEAYAKRIRAAPHDFIGQPTLSLSACPTFVESGIAPRHVDLRPFVLSGADGVRTVPGGLTRVALKEGSLVVNSSQGGGTKDTWVLSE